MAIADNPAEIFEKIVCPRCCAVLDAGDNYCRRCGQPTGVSQPESPRRIVTTERKSDWTQSRVVVLAMLFAVLGPLALPMLWRSRNFSMMWKIVLTVATVAITALVVYLLWYFLYQALEPLRNLRNGIL